MDRGRNEEGLQSEVGPLRPLTYYNISMTFIKY